MPPNPYESPNTDAGYSSTSRLAPAIRRALTFSTCLLVGIIASQLLVFLFALNEGPNSFIFLGVFGLILGVLGGSLANLLHVDRIQWYYIVIGFGLLLLGLLVIESPNYSGAASLIAVIAFTQMLASLCIGLLSR